MRNFHKLIILACLLGSANAFASYEVFIDPLYWRATENFDWLHATNLSTPNTVISYKSITYDFTPGFRVGASYEGDWDTKLYYTRFYTTANQSASGNLTGGFVAGRLTQTFPATVFYQTGQANFIINFNMLDWDIGKHFNVTQSLMLRPLIGLEGAIINQTFNTSFQSATLADTEQAKNNFRGLGPKVGIETRLIFLDMHDFQYSLIADFATSYMWGDWDLTQTAQTNTAQFNSVVSAQRNFGAFGMQGMLGASVTHKDFSVKLGYEISDWFDQCQVFSDETGTQNNDLVLQGLTLSLAYRF